MAHAVQLIDEPAAAAAALHPLRRRILEHLQEQDSAAGVARALSLPRQRVTYHVRELERRAISPIIPYATLPPALNSVPSTQYPVLFFLITHHPSLITAFQKVNILITLSSHKTPQNLLRYNVSSTQNQPQIHVFFAHFPPISPKITPSKGKIRRIP
jgi:hypothetical protein